MKEKEARAAVSRTARAESRCNLMIDRPPPKGKRGVRSHLYFDAGLLPHSTIGIDSMSITKTCSRTTTMFGTG